MNNYQLYSTNVLLGGQMKWDIVLESDGDLFIKDFHITPINDNVPYNKYTEDNLLNYNHQENLKSYYKKIEGYFYNIYTSPDFNHDWPIISDHYIKNYDDTYIMGCKRSKENKLYNKQFEFLCPVWIEKLTSPLHFTIKINSKNKVQIAKKTLSLDLKSKKFNDSFVNYFNNYIKYLNLDQGDGDVININLDRKTADLVGIDIRSGNIVRRNIDTLIQNILYRERPMMEVDSMIINSFRDNYTITKQLFNFNLCFNIEDIVTEHIDSLLVGGRFNIEVFVGDDEGEYPLVDFYTNYQDIQRIYSGLDKPLDKSVNVFDYLKDNKCIDFVNKNKFSPTIVHWSLCDNNDYIFNLYRGFNGYTLGENNEVLSTELYNDTPDLTQPKYSKYLNNINWTNSVIINEYQDFTNRVNNFFEIRDLESTFFGSNWVNNIKYRNKSNIYVISMYVPNPDVYELIKKVSYKINDNLYVYIFDKVSMVYLISDNLDNLTFKSMLNILNEYTSSHDSINILESLKSQMETAIDLPMVVFNNSLSITGVDGPSLSVKEISYLKENNTCSYMLRYDGKIKPSFVSDNNFVYYKDYITDDEFADSVYSKYANTKFPPLYESIDYCSIKRSKLKYDTPLNNYDLEYKWYNDGAIYYLYKEISCVLYSEFKDGQYVSLENIIKNYLKNLYNVDDEIVEKIYNSYNIEYNFDYKSVDNINDYQYNIKLTLK